MNIKHAYALLIQHLIDEKILVINRDGKFEPPTLTIENRKNVDDSEDWIFVLR